MKRADQLNFLKSLFQKEALVKATNCFECGEKKDDFIKCEKCKAAAYCDSSCKEKHWEGAHKTECGGIDMHVSAQVFFPPMTTGDYAGRHGFFEADTYLTAPNTLKPKEKMQDEREMMEWLVKQCPRLIGPELKKKGHKVCHNECKRAWTQFVFTGGPGTYAPSKGVGASRVVVHIKLFPCCASEACSKAICNKMAADIADATSGLGLMMNGSFYPSSGNPMFGARAR